MTHISLVQWNLANLLGQELAHVKSKCTHLNSGRYGGEGFRGSEPPLSSDNLSIG